MTCKASYSIPVRASRDTLWAVLRDKAENPGRYIAGFIASEVLEKTGNSILCRLHTDRFDIIERITIDAAHRAVSFEMVDHPHYTGMLVNRIEPALSDDGYPVLTYAYDWELREGVSAADDLSDLVQNALQRAKTIAEAGFPRVAASR